MRVLLLSQMFWTDIASTPQHLKDLAVAIMKSAKHAIIVGQDGPLRIQVPPPTPEPGTT